MKQVGLKDMSLDSEACQDQQHCLSFLVHQESTAWTKIIESKTHFPKRKQKQEVETLKKNSNQYF